MAAFDEWNFRSFERNRVKSGILKTVGIIKNRYQGFLTEKFSKDGSQGIRIGAMDGGFGGRTRSKETQWQINWPKMTQVSLDQIYTIV